MMTVASITISGIAAIRARLTPQAFRTALVGALQEALAPVASNASALAPKKTGKLAGGIRAAVSTRGGALSAAIVTGVRYGHLVEYGHREVVGGRSARRSFSLLTRRGSGTGRQTGVVPPHPFAGPAFLAQQGQITQIIERRLAAAIAGHE